MGAEITNTEIKRKIEHFTDLYVWQLGQLLVKDIYEKTKSFPPDELYGLTSQIRRAVVSITSNIAEGMGRISYKDRIRFLYNSRGSLFEVENLLYIASNLEYLEKDDFISLLTKVEEVRKILNGFINSTEKFIS